MRDEEKREWDRQPRETSRAFELFCAYRDLGTERSLRKLKQGTNGAPNVNRLKRLSTRWNWVERARAYDDFGERQRRQQQEKERREMNERQAKIGVLGQNLAVKGVEKLLADVQEGKKKLGAAELARLLDVSAKLERLARGESTDIHEAVGRGGGPVRLSIENVEQRAREAIEQSLGISDPSPLRGAEADREVGFPPVPDPLGE